MIKDKVKEIKKKLIKHPRDLLLHLELAQIFEQQHLYQEASDEYNKVTAIAPDNTGALTGLGRTLFYLKDYDAAERILLKCCKNNLYATSVLAKIYLEKKDAMLAQQYYEEAKKIDPNYKDKTLEALYGIKISPEDLTTFAPTESTKTFRDIGGLANLKRQIQLKIIEPYKKPELFKTYGKKAGGGLLLYGPPGCGKTLLAEATAGEIKANFFNIELTDVLDHYWGKSEKRLHNIFETARRKAPSVIFIDEIDALGASRSTFHQAETKGTVNQLLTEMDGLNKHNENILIIGATNMPWQVDSAFKRPGRFDQLLFVPPPDEEARQEIITLFLKDKPQKNIDIPLIVRNTEGYSGADLRYLIEKTVESLLDKALASNTVIPLTTNDLIATIKKIIPSTLEWFLTAKNFVDYANTSGQYDEVSNYIRKQLKGKI